MEIKELPLSAIKIWEPEARLPISDADLLSSAWRAMPIVRGKMLAVTVVPSAKYPDFVHYEVWYFGSGETVTSKNPVYPSHAADFLNHALAQYELRAESLGWRRCEQAAPDAPKAEVTKDCEFVYFLAAGPFVKIGKSTGSPSARIRELQTGCPYPITLVAHAVGGLKEEFALHKRFASYREHGEWFRHEGDLAAHIAAVAGVAA